MKGFASPINSMCDLANLGGFKIKFTLCFEFSTVERSEEFFTKLVDDYEEVFKNMKVKIFISIEKAINSDLTANLTCNLHLYTRY